MMTQRIQEGKVALVFRNGDYKRVLKPGFHFIGLFDEVEPQTVAWFRVIGAAIAVVVASRAWRERWTRAELLAAGLFGVVTALMNTFF